MAGRMYLSRFMRHAGLVAGMLIVVMFVGIVSASTVASNGSASPVAKEALRALCLGNGQATTDVHKETGRLTFIGTDAEKPIALPVALPAAASPEVTARAYLSMCGTLFGIRDQERELTVMTHETDAQGRSFVRFQQVYQGIPVLGGELIVQSDSKKNIMSVIGETLPDLALSTTPAIDADTARQRALAKVAKDYDLDVDALAASDPELWIYNPAILGGPGPRLTRLVWRMEVTPVDLLPIRELVLIDAHTGIVALHFNQIDTARNRRVYDNNNVRSETLQNPANLRRTEGQAASGIADVDRAYDFTGDTYDFYSSQHQRDSVNNAGMSLISTTRYCPPRTSDPCPYPNAFWNGQQMAYGQGFVVDDVVAHEITHGVTNYASRLFYYYQSGAINEAFSDIWGEFIDLTNGKGNDSSSVRWLMGEDLPEGAIRSMSNPPAYGDPDRMTSSLYKCDLEERDNGGVHSNSGVGNKAAFLMVDGGTFNGKTVTGLGIPKVASIFYEVQTRLLTSAGDYQDLYNALQQACTNLIGVNGITAADCQQVRQALDAVEMNRQPSACPAPEAPVCDAGNPNNLFFDDLENPSSGRWTTGALRGLTTWYYPQNSHPYTGLDVTYATSGRYNIWGDNPSSVTDSFIRMTSDVMLPAGSVAYMHFNHAYGFEDSTTGASRYDGGVVEYSTDGGASWVDAGSLFINNGYNGTLSSGTGNPLAGRQAFGGESNGYISSRLNLQTLAGRNVRFRFRIGTDSSDGDHGWFIDDIRIYTCSTSASTPTPTSASTPTQTPISPPASHKVSLPMILKPASSAPGTPAPTPTPTLPSTPTPTLPSTPTPTSPSTPTPTLPSTPTPTPPSTPTPTPPSTPTPTLPSTPTPTPPSTPTPTPPSSGWRTLVSTTFENDFPGPWRVYDDDGSSNGEYFWAQRSCQLFEGSFSGWAVGGGGDGSTLACGADYSDSASALMEYGPFSLVGATGAELRFKLWMNTEPDYDKVCAAASVDSTNWYGSCWSGNSGGWVDRRFDLSNVHRIGNLLGRPQVWILLWFVSNESVTYPEGVYVDNIALRVCPAGASCPATSSVSAADTMTESPFAITRSR